MNKGVVMVVGLYAAFERDFDNAISTISNRFAQKKIFCIFLYFKLKMGKTALIVWNCALNNIYQPKK